ncbi:Cystatin [Fasciola gigantica]|uniref:Cystatin n=1 Tax=Fasciola gigantica TaxID=46835 RepID=A0A504Y949_FASGI|nr:Cystatin [Fasciola gigantica]
MKLITFWICLICVSGCRSTEKRLCGGYDEPKAVQQDDIDKFESIVTENLRRSGSLTRNAYLTFLTVSKQVVAGINYKFLVKSSGGQCFEVLLFEPLPHTELPPSVKSFTPVECPS